ncbi:hypothetical protein NEF87_001098 [Candidatus Lokiarchaeum ossiferum]|uniref:Acyltransferase 3 domain-containing protein n=1 Tax=Candidatus Lokiarchaeum ossiferum TaxID=2951803 RepID=A0ABY6HMS3_9ARCH|nr:hypothetical protein NEF87_001098 [Candidatus Lokiarchaeum sp. B-35]
MRRYITIDFLRGFGIMCVCFIHLFTDLLDEESLESQLNDYPIILVIILLFIVYFGCWGSMFVMISATGNIFSMQRNLEKGNDWKSVMKRQVLFGFLLLMIALIVEGTLQKYGFLGTLIWGPVDFTRIIWHSYVMSPLMCLSVCMIINGIIYPVLCRNNGHLKFNRNILIFIGLSIIILIATQPIWNSIRSLIPGYPTADYPSNLDPTGNKYISQPLMGWPITKYFEYFIFLIVAGQNTPIFPYLSYAFVGNIIAIVIFKAEKKEQKKTSDLFKSAIIAGFIGVIGILIAIFFMVTQDVGPFDVLIPLDNDYDDITALSNGLYLHWLPWFLMVLAGQIIAITMLFRLLEFRGASNTFAKYSRPIRRFGIPALSIYTFQRFFALIPIGLISLSLGNEFLVGDSDLYDFGTTMFIIAVSFVFIYLILLVWEKTGYFGSLEWAIGTIASILAPKMPKAKSLLILDNDKEEKRPWYTLGMMDADFLLNQIEWIDLLEEKTTKEIFPHDSRLVLKVILPLSLLYPLLCPMICYSLAKKEKGKLGKNRINLRAIQISSFILICQIIFTIGLSIFSLSDLGLNLF